MSFKVFFMFSNGLAQPLKVPKGTTERVISRIKKTEAALGLVAEKYLDNPPHWTTKSKEFKGIDDKTVCRHVEDHNDTIRWFYSLLANAKDCKKPWETITPKKAKEFWYGLELLDVDPNRWTAEYYQSRMEAMYEAMRGREAEGMVFDASPLTTEQARSVINLVSEFLDTHDIRLDVCKGYDHLSSSDEYCWCERCGAIHDNDMLENKDGVRKCPGCRRLLY